MKSATTIERLADSAGRGETQTLLTAIFNTSVVGLAICDKQLRFRAVNKALAAINGVAPQAHIGKTIREVLGNGAVPLEAPFKHVFFSGREISNLEVCAKIAKRDAVGYWIEDYFPIRDAEGRVEQVGAFVVEVTEQKKLQQSLQNVADNLIQTLRLTSHDSDELVRRILEKSHRQIPDSDPNRRRSAPTGSPKQAPSSSTLALTPREREVVKLLAEGSSNRKTAAILGISIKTVESHRARIMLKLGLHSTPELVYYAISNRILDPANMAKPR